MVAKAKTGDILDMNLLRRVLKFASPYKYQFLLGTIAAVLLSFLGPLRPVLINYAIDNYILSPNSEKLLQITYLLIFLLIIEGIVQFYYIFLSTWIGQHVIQDLRSITFKHILSLKMRYFEDMSFKQISKLTGVSINTALGRMRYALINLRNLAKEKNVDLSQK